jgi:hypothetical protein
MLTSAVHYQLYTPNITQRSDAARNLEGGQARHDFGLGFQVNVPDPLKVVPDSLRRGNNFQGLEKL